jgi:hypothetical protein
MEWWNNGIMGMKTDDVLILFSDQCRRFKNRYHTAKRSIPAFHYSNTPWRFITTIRLRQTELAWSARFPMLE